MWADVTVCRPTSDRTFLCGGSMTADLLRSIFRILKSARTGAALLLVIGVPMFGGCKPSRQPGPLPDIRITSAALSAAGDRVAFSFEDERDGTLRKRIGLYDVVSRSIQLVPQPARFKWAEPVFSPMGERLAFTSFCFYDCTEQEFGYHIGVLDLQTGGWEIVTTDGRAKIRLSPNFSPDGKSLLFSTARAGWSKEGGSRPKTFFGVSSLSLETRSETQLLPHGREATTFQLVGRPTLTTRGDILFTCMAPFQSAFADWVKKQGYRLSDYIGCRLESDGTLGVLPGLEGRNAAALSASADGGRVLFVARSRGYDHDLFYLEKGSVHRATQLETYMYKTDISDDGTVALYLADETREMNWSVWLVGVGSGDTREILTSQGLRAFLGERDHAPAMAAE